MDPLILFNDVRIVVVKMIKQGNKLTSCPSDLMYGQQQEFTEIRTARKTHSLATYQVTCILRETQAFGSFLTLTHIKAEFSHILRQTSWFV